MVSETLNSSILRKWLLILPREPGISCLACAHTVPRALAPLPTTFGFEILPLEPCSSPSWAEACPWPPPHLAHAASPTMSGSGSRCPHKCGCILEVRPSVTSQLSSLGLGSFGAVGRVWAAILCQEQRQPARSWSSPEGTSQRHYHRRLRVKTGTLWSRRSLLFFPRVAREFCGQTWDGPKLGP